jgi:two-component system, OmpR family, alkaline phosphatase synthesis response regulator PhoP
VATILVVEDNPLIQDMLYEILQNQGFTVVCADNGTIGLQAAKAQSPDLIISDLEMPDLNGLELLRRLRQDASIASVPVIICSSVTNSQAQHQALQMGATAYLHKPFNLTQLTKTVTAQLRARAATPI